MSIDALIGRTGEWLRGEGPESDIVISTRVRLARNIAEFPFMSRSTDEQKRDLERLLSAKTLNARLADDMIYVGLEDLPEIDRLYLMECHLISREHAEAEGARGVAVGRQATVSIMVNEEDHLRMQGIRSGLELEATWGMMSEIDDVLQDDLCFAFSDRFGYLTACPTNVGTGMRVSVMLHLPALAITRHIEKVFNAVAKMNLVVRGLYGEGTQAYGDLYQISNQVTLGKSEQDIIEGVASVIPRVAAYERQARRYLMDDKRPELEDRVWRSYGMLRNARTITSEETMHLLSQVRMGVNLALVGQVEMKTVNELFVLTLPAHLQKQEGRILEADERNVARARLVRTKLEV